ncbi:MAG TPA: HD domain-containing phosphohydrolase [Acidimicrobiia bacterium]|nr:HD domain-containing phosphohydrolase [Acidimicrobiia bacterium]
MNTQDRIGTIYSGTLAALGAATLIGLFVLQESPGPLWLWVTFAAAFVALEFSSVEVNDRLFVSGSIMVAFTAATVFGRESAVLAVALMAAIAAFHPDDLRQRRWRQPAGNFGQLVFSATVGVTVFLPFLPDGPVEAPDLPLLAAGAALSAAVYDWVNFGLVRFMVRRLYPERTLHPWLKMLTNHVALAVLGAFGGILGAAYVLVGPVILPLIFVTFLVGQMGFHSYSKLRSAHEDTIRGFVKAVEALDPYTRGHTERVAAFVRMTAERLGFEPDRLERLRWAALIHDVGKVAVPAALLHKPDSLTDEEYRRMVRHMRVVEDVLAGVDFLAPMVGIAAAHHALLDGSTDVAVEGRILAAADAFDAMTSTRSYRSAVTQRTAFDQLRRRREIYGVEVVETLIAAIEMSSEVYGSPDDESAAVVERLVRERAIRA